MLQAALDEDEAPEELGGRGGKRREREEDEFYQEAKAAAGEKLGSLLVKWN